MCGIAGVRQFGADPITREEIIFLLCELEHRGNHATGIALLGPDGLAVHKAPVPAWAFTKSKTFNEFLEQNLTRETKTALLHTRFATIGNPEFNQNNHPMWDNHTAIVHNGHISNHNHLFTQGNYRRLAETDSDVVRAILSHHGITEKGLRELNKMDGSAAIACVDATHPEKLLLARSGSPLVVGFTPGGTKLYWASEAQAIKMASRPYHQIMGISVQAMRSDVLMCNMPNDTAWVFDGNMRTLHHEFNTCKFYRQPSYAGMNSSYHSKTKQWKKEQKAAKAAAKKKDEVADATEKVVEQIRTDITKRETPNRTPRTQEILGRPYVNSVAVCGGCGTSVQNKNGTPWELVDCPACHQPIHQEGD